MLNEGRAARRRQVSEVIHQSDRKQALNAPRSRIEEVIVPSAERDIRADIIRELHVRTALGVIESVIIIDVDIRVTYRKLSRVLSSAEAKTTLAKGKYVVDPDRPSVVEPPVVHEVRYPPCLNEPALAAKLDRGTVHVAKGKDGIQSSLAVPARRKTNGKRYSYNEYSKNAH